MTIDLTGHIHRDTVLRFREMIFPVYATVTRFPESEVQRFPMISVGTEL